MSEDISPYCLAHDEWLIMKLCMCVGYHVANNVSHFGGDPVTRLHFVNVTFKKTAVLRARRTGFAAVPRRSRAGCWSMEYRRRKSLINWSYQPTTSLVGYTGLSAALVLVWPTSWTPAVGGLIMCE